jgi:peptidoglycan hydrolase-like protein with peptidoglycan-binding domain
MPFSLTWLPDVLKAAGLKVSEVDGWQDRGRGEIGRVLGVICHHTGVPSGGNMPTLNSLINGRKGSPASSGHPAVSPLAGPLAQLGLGRDGTYFVVAAGRANHAGKGSFQGVADRGNETFIGIEAENTGLKSDPWPDVQMDAYQRGVAAILTHVGQGVNFCIGHKEYAPGRKDDPNFNMTAFRASVAAIMNGTAPAPTHIPVAEPPVTPGAPASRPTLRLGATGDLVDQVQAKVGVAVDGNFGPNTEAAVRAFQRAHGLVPDGIVGPNTWAALDGV